MKPFHAFLFLKAKGFLRNYQAFSVFGGIPGLGREMRADLVIGERIRTSYLRAWSSLREFIEDLDMDASLASLDRMLEHLKDPTSTYGAYWAEAAQFEGRLADQLKKRTFMSLSLSEAAAFNEPLRGWEEVIERLPEARGDVEEARKCQALGRYAAAVFHSLQVVEVGMIALGEEIGVTDHQTGWGATRNKLTAILKTKHEDRSDFEKKHFKFLEQVQATIEALNSAWRNKVSHAEGKFSLLTADFTPDVTEEILTATRSFMRRLVTEGPLATPPA